MKSFRIGLVLIVWASAGLVSCDKLQEYSEGEYYDEWAMACFFGNSAAGETSTFTLYINQGYTKDSETLCSGEQIHLTIIGPATDGFKIPSGQYWVSEKGAPFTITKDRFDLVTYSFIEHIDRKTGKKQRYPLEEGKVRIDQHEDGYSVKLRVIAGGRQFDHVFDGEVFSVDSTWGGL